MADLFICSSNVDHDLVTPVAEALEAAGFSCCIPGRDYEMAFDWQEAMVDAVYSATMALYFHSESTGRSRRIRQELDTIRESGILLIETEAGKEPAGKMIEAVRSRFAEAQEKRRQSTRLMPYTGEEPYIFVSYAHKNIDRVFPLIRLLQQNGYRIWFDEGIDPGTEWADNIASHLQASSYFCACMSQQYLESTNCCDELSYARVKSLPFLLLALEPVRLKDGMEMNNVNSLVLDPEILRDEEAFLKAVRNAKGILLCREPEDGEENTDV